MARVPGGALKWSGILLRQLSTAAAEVREGSLSAAWGAGRTSAPPKLLYRQISALGGQPKGVVTKAMNKWIREGNPVVAADVVRFVKELRKYKRFGHALELMEWMDTRGMNMSHSNYAVRLDLICRVEGIAAAEQYFASFPESAKNLLTYGSLLNCYCMEKMEEEASAFFEMMKRKKLIVSSSLPYDNMMSLYMRLGKPEKVPFLVAEMTAGDIRPSDFTYSILMNSYAAVNDFAAMERTLEKIEQPRWSIYTGLASLYLAAGNSDKAAAALRKAEGSIDRGDRQCFHFLITLYAGLGKPEEVNRVWAALKASFPATLNMSYLAMMQSLSRLERLEQLEECFREWEAGCATYDIRLANILLGAYLRRDMAGAAEELWKKVGGWKGCAPDFRSYEILIDYYVGKEEMGKARELMEAAVAKAEKEGGGRAWKPNKAKLDAFVKYFEEEAEGDAKAAELRERLRKLEEAA